jgi:hypothetical protein
LISGHQEKDLHYIKHKENKMPRAKKKTTTTKKRAPRKAQRRKTTDRRKRTSSGNIIGNFRGQEDVFWTKVVNGFKKLLSPAFKK